jgi:Kdo2-lipid IVA lauroyltransferase/acyltransferase
MARRRNALGEALAALPVIGLRGLMALLPWRTRLGLAGALGRLAVTRIGRLRRRVQANLHHVMPELGAAERDRILRDVGDGFGRTVTEMLFARAFAARRPWRGPDGPGAEALVAAVRGGKSLILISGHIGQWEAGRAWVKSQGRQCAGVYRPVRNRWLDALYRRNIGFTGAPVFPKGRGSVRAIARHIADGGVLALLVDQHERRGQTLDFLGRPAPTTLIAAEFALRYGVPVFPAFAIRAPDGVTIDMHIEAPLPHTTPREMMQSFNDLLAAQVRAHPGQYYWLHRRWAKDMPGASPMSQ